VAVQVYGAAQKTALNVDGREIRVELRDANAGRGRGTRRGGGRGRTDNRNKT